MTAATSSSSSSAAAASAPAPFSSIASRVDCKSFETFKFPSIALLHQCHHRFKANTKHKASSSTVASDSNSDNNNNNASPILSRVFAFTYELECESMRMYVLMCFLDRWFPYRNGIKKRAFDEWFPVVVDELTTTANESANNNNAASSATMSSSATTTARVESSQFATPTAWRQAFRDKYGDETAQWRVDSEPELGVRLAEELLSPSSWMHDILREKLGGVIAVVVSDRQRQHKNIHSGAVCIAYDDEHAKTKQQQQQQDDDDVCSSSSSKCFWTWNDLFAKRKQLVSMLNRSDVLRYDAICECDCLLAADFVLDLAGRGTFPGNGEGLLNMQVLPRGLHVDRLFAKEPPPADGPYDPSVIALDLKFHTVPNQLLMLYPSIANLAEHHYAYLRDAARSVEEFDGLELPGFSEERTPFVTIVPRLFSTATHEQSHCVQGLCGQVDPTTFKMVMESGASFCQESLTFIIAKHYCGDDENNDDDDDDQHDCYVTPLSHIFPRGLAEVLALTRAEGATFRLQHYLDDDLRGEFDKFLMEFGSRKIARLDDTLTAATGAVAGLKVDAWTVSDTMSYNVSMPFFTTSKAEIGEMLRLLYSPPRWNCSMLDVPRAVELQEAIRCGRIGNPVEKMKTILVPPRNGRERVVVAAAAVATETRL